MITRWIVRNKVQTPECGNGIWSRHRTKRGAQRCLEDIMAGRFRLGFYTLPEGGLVVCRASEAFSRNR